ncbi:MAG: ribosomal protein S18-alanine N-acetyltransferase [Veillonella sp.]|uniref:ribosomal protein S18-alanine N-acetyltransferase n=1 Tax=Veillonella sp. TaxID=1926307 RepID=UPI0025E92A78|nr:ribosomal protein S18-alanine N-acetyltransferase [Veillonella sp.]MBS4912723.1 ribosomal protein S18-alanine N-acetyltransferase [Veillonella sp.]
MLILRRATPDDAEAIFEVEQACFSIPWSLSAIEAELDEDMQEQRLYLVAEEEGQIVAYAGAWLVLDEGQITNIAVIPEARRQGIGAMITRKLMRLLFEASMNEIFLEVRLSNLGALAMYRRLGFTVKGIRKNYYTEPVEDAYIMSCTKDEIYHKE